MLRTEMKNEEADANKLFAFGFAAAVVVEPSGLAG